MSEKEPGKIINYLDTNQLIDLWTNDPEAAERYHRQILEEHIEGIPDPERRKRARAMQWRIDQELSRYTDKTARLNRMIELFWAGFFDWQAALNDPKGFKERQDGRKADVLEFPKRGETA